MFLNMIPSCSKFTYFEPFTSRWFDLCAPLLMSELSDFAFRGEFDGAEHVSCRGQIILMFFAGMTGNRP